MDQGGNRFVVALLGLVAGLAAIASAAGVFLRGDLATTSFVTVRGEHVDLLVGGIYRFNGKPIAAEGVGWDIVTLFLVVPVLVAALPLVWRGSLRASLVAIGILAYLLYQYFEYATFLAYGPLFLLYVGIFSLSLTGIVLMVANIRLAELSERFTARFPRRWVVALGAYMAVLLGGLWLPLIAQSFNAAVVDQLDGASTLVVQAFDLGLLIPLGIFTAVTVYRRLPVGYLLASVVVVKAVALGTAIAAMMVIEAFATGVLQPVPIAIFAFTAIGSALLGIRVYGSIQGATETTGAAPLRRMAHPTSAA